MVQRLLLLSRPGSIKAHWVASQWDLPGTWEWAFPAPWDTMAMKFPPNMVKYVAMKVPCWLEKLALASYLYKDYIMTTACCWPSTPLERNSGWSEKRHSVLWEKPRRTSLQSVRWSLVHISLNFSLSWFLLEYNKSPSDSLTRIFPDQHLDNAETSHLVIPWTLLSVLKCTLTESRQRELKPGAPWCPYSLKKPQWSSPLFLWDWVPKCLWREIGR